MTEQNQVSDAVDEECSWFQDWQAGWALIMEQMAADMHAVSCAVSRGPHEYLRRVYVRTLFATIEADVFQRKQLALLGHGKTHTFDSSELAVLRELQFNVQHSGEIVESPKYIPLPANYRLSFKLAAKVIGSRFQLDCSRQEWQDFVYCVGVRNRITHPKTAQDIVVTVQDLKRARSVADWCHGNMPDFLLAAVRDE